MNYQEKAKKIVIDYYNDRVEKTDNKKLTANLDAYKKWENVCVKDVED